MTGWSSLVVGIDFTPCSAAALAQVLCIAERSQAKLHVVHVIENLVVADLEDALGAFQSDVRASLVEDAVEAWKELAAGLPAASGLEIAVEVDHPVSALLRHVREQGADLLVLGTHGTSPPDRGAGTLATACVRRAGTNVLLVRDEQSGAFNSVVACIDFSRTSGKALERAVRVAAQDRAALHVLHVFEGPWHRLHYRAPTPQASPDYQKQYRDGLERRLKAFCEPAVRELAQLRIEYAVFDHPGHGRGITEYVERVGGELVVLGTRGRANLRDMLIGSTAERVVRDAPCSVLAVPPDPTDA